jgi:hypothetical protein
MRGLPFADTPNAVYQTIHSAHVKHAPEKITESGLNIPNTFLTTLPQPEFIRNRPKGV